MTSAVSHEYGHRIVVGVAGVEIASYVYHDNQNFWGGHSYVRDQGYTRLDNVGRIRHDSFTLVDLTPTWREPRGRARAEHGK